MKALNNSIVFFKKSIFTLIVLIISFAGFIWSGCPRPIDPAYDHSTVPVVAIIPTVIVKEITYFPMGDEHTYAIDAQPVHRVPLINSFRMGKYEVTYYQWYYIKKWAIYNGYKFANDGREGNSGTTGAVPTFLNDQPAAGISWRDCIVWCNAASQYFGLTPLYYSDSELTVLLIESTNNHDVDLTIGSEDNPYVNWSANGFRLPSEAEWEAAARYQNGIDWAPGTYASGATADFLDAVATGNVAWYTANSGSVTHNVGSKYSNQLGIYDMSGNLNEWCWDWFNVYRNRSPFTDSNTKGPAYDLYGRTVRGGCWGTTSNILMNSTRASYDPDDFGTKHGFRVA